MSSKGLNFFLLFLAALSGVMVCLYQTASYGAGVTPDSVFYLSTAQNLWNGNGFNSFDGPIHYWPPLFSIMLALGPMVGLEPLDTARYLNALVFGSIIFLSGYWLTCKLKNKTLAWIGVMIFAISPVLNLISIYAWAEPTFLLFTLCSLYCVAEFINRSQLRTLIYAAVFASLVVMTRHTGVTVILTGGLLLLFRSKINWPQKIKNVILFGLISSLPYLLWTLRTYMISGTLAGRRSPSERGFTTNLLAMADEISSWFIPLWRLKEVSGASVLLVGFIIGMTGITLVRRKQEGSFSSTEFEFFSAHALFIFVYSAFLLWSVSTVALEPIGTRYMSSVYISVWFLVLLVCDRYPISLNLKISASKLNIFLIGLFFTWLALYPIRQMIPVIKERNINGVGLYTTGEWVRDQVLNFFRNQKLSGEIYSNVPDFLYLQTGLKAKFAPLKHYNNAPSVIITSELEKLASLVEINDNVFLVWFERGIKVRPHLYHPKDIKKVVDMETVFSSPDGAVYHLKPLNSELRN